MCLQYIITIKSNQNQMNRVGLNISNNKTFTIRNWLESEVSQQEQLNGQKRIWNIVAVAVVVVIRNLYMCFIFLTSWFFFRSPINSCLTCTTFKSLRL